ncbi:EAL domain-containing protein [Novosphingobium album (ex Hu et al. 2023)]|uniref:EAL domain-containing protein n=1 Tax=Novosphingobium album (ex Hu et al. 2023) TaxID=2930093 RepID=A0ABT0B1N8_9SPHN|nr:EAL domain-containing protein [Novosphingobium album (ex Hu et al. 2023)]MCJ2178830.1 EAL domain-containing protein [Novosphingobium album (ex Hu et al. 2023)]
MGDSHANPLAELYLCISQEHRPGMVLLALAAATLASACAVSCWRQARNRRGVPSYTWTVLSGLTLGTGAWSAHQIAFLGYLPGSPFTFDFPITLASLVLVLTSGVTCMLLLLHLPSRGGVLTASLLFGGGIAVMHYTGIAAVQMPAQIHWDPEYVTTSIILGVFFGLPAFSLTSRFHGKLTASIGVLFFSLLITATYATGMTALQPVPARAMPHAMSMSPANLAVWIGLVTMGLFVLGLLVALSNYKALTALAKSERQLSFLVNNSSDYAICMLDRDGCISQWNTGAQQLTGYSAEDAVGMPMARLFTPEDCTGGLPAQVLKIAAETGICKGMWDSRRRDGTRFSVEGTIEKVCDDKGQHIGFSAITHDVTRIRQAQALAAETSRQLDTALENMHEGLCLFDAEERVVLCNQRFRELWNLTEADTVPGTPLGRLIVAGFMNTGGPQRAAEQLWEFRQIIDDALGEERASPVMTELDGSRVISMANSPLADGGWVTTCTDITEQRRSEATIEHMAFHDAMTGLPNRARYHRRLDHAIEKAAERGTHIAAIAIDLDRFKEINDTYGHAAGDEALQAIAGRLTSVMGDGEVTARLGGDEFAAAKSFNDRAELDEFLTRLTDAFVAPVTIQARSLSLATSLGVAVYPRDGEDRETLLNNADLALQRTKSSIGLTVCFFEPDMDESARARRQLASDLRHAVPSGELRLLYQPQRSLKTGEISGYEALLRWHHPKRGLISPTEFIPLAEETGDIFAIGDWVLQEACAEARHWPETLKVAVNLSPVQFLQDGLIERFRAILLQTGLSPNRLELEVTESAIITDKLRALHYLRQFKAMGVSVAIDDFGTGHSSLDTLHAFPFDKIKIDKSFLLRAETSHQALAIIRTVLSLGRSLSIPVLAEGVETQGQLQVLESEGCDEAQGYYFGRPAAAPSLDLPDAVNF